jgi:hypothetical protein
MHKLIISLSSAALFGFSASAAAQLSPFVEAQIQAAVTPCSDEIAKVNGATEEVGTAAVVTALPLCYAALAKLDDFEKENAEGLTPIELSYFYYMGGNTIWLTAGAEAFRNKGIITIGICTQVNAAETAWGNVRVEPDSEIDIQMKTNQLRQILLPVCQVEPKGLISDPE